MFEKITGLGKTVIGKITGLGPKFMALSTAKKVIAGVVAAAVAGGSVTGGVVLANSTGGSSQPEVLEAVIEETTEYEALLDTESEGDSELAVTEGTETEEENAADRIIKLVGSSIEKDLKVKIQNRNSENVSGQDFAITVQKSGNSKEDTYTDDDKDGIIYIQKIDAGDYTVALKEMPDFDTPDPIEVTVKDKIEYKKVDVSDEIKQDSQVSAAEDAEKNNSLPVESVAQDTVESLPSTVTPSEVPASSVATSAFPKASAGASATKTLDGLTTSSLEIREKSYVAEGITDTTENAAATVTNDVTDPASAAATETPSTQATETPSTETPSTQTTETPSTQSTESGTKQTTAAITLSYPGSVTLYNGGGTAATTYEVVLTPSATVNTTVQWIGDSSGVYKVSGSGLKATVSATGTAGKGGLGVRVTYSGGYVDLYIPIMVQDASATELTDASGNKLYKDKECTTVATLKDYSETATFYLPGGYTGWQTINGKTYYYNSNHQPVTGTQTIGGVQYTFGADGALATGSTGGRGIDVSKWNGSINWAAVKAAGIDFVIIRCGYRGSQTGALVEDPMFRTNIKGATAAGLKVGVYFFTQAVTEAEAVEEASMCLQLCSGYNLAYPIFIDTEDGARAQGLDSASRTAIMNAFSKTIASGGRRPGVYASTYWYNSKLNAGSLSGTIWVAQYAAACAYKGSYSIWQYSSKGTVAGINGYVDMNIAY